MSSVSQNFHPESEAALNKQINVELYASYVYLSMASFGAYFDRDDVALPGFSRFFYKCSEEERTHALKFIKYQTLRGGRVIFQNIDKPAHDEWGSGLEAMETALALEKSVNQSLLDLHAIASSHQDANLTDFLEHEFLEEQIESIKRLSDYVTNLNRVGAGIGEYLFDRHTLGSDS
ncbi:Soma ferritin [Trichinella britovi]|uniref:Ferritin n=3 Tax=Trichinella TaxID=6333 RepID=A0A0V1CXM9_TRIBR